MNLVWYDPDCDQIWLSTGARTEAYPGRSLVAVHDGGMIGVRMKAGAANLRWAPFDAFSGYDGQAFADPGAALAYLAETFAAAPSWIPRLTLVAGEDIPAGTPVAVARSTGLARIARADTYTLAFVAGFAADDAAAGFPVAVLRANLTRADWSTLADAAVLRPGLPYCLGPAGGFTAEPDRTPGRSLVRLGTAADARTLLFAPTDPILL